LKLQGVSYQEIAARGGGIKGTVRKTREIGHDELVAVCRQRLDRMLLSGTTTLEAKSGYGLDLDTELKQLQALRARGPPGRRGPHLHGRLEIPEFRAAAISGISRNILQGKAPGRIRQFFARRLFSTPSQTICAGRCLQAQDACRRVHQQCRQLPSGWARPEDT
jgi:imidazolonepropionase-like amidohydrolase